MHSMIDELEGPVGTQTKNDPVCGTEDAEDVEDVPPVLETFKPWSVCAIFGTSPSGSASGSSSSVAARSLKYSDQHCWQ